MAVPDIQTAPEVLDHLDPLALAELVDSLYPGACQTCGDPFDAAPTLAVDQHVDVAQATLHHHRCRRSEWNNTGITVGTTRPYLTYTIATLIGQTADGTPNHTNYVPMVLINPSLECLLLECDPRGRWAPLTNSQYTTAGLTLPDAVDDNSTADGITAHLAAGKLIVDLHPPIAETYEVAVDDDTRFLAETRERLLVVITHAIDPAQAFTHDELNRVLAGDRTVMAWAAVTT